MLLAFCTGIAGTALWELLTGENDGLDSAPKWVWFVGSVVLSVSIVYWGALQGARELDRLRPFRRVNQVVPTRPFEVIITAISADSVAERRTETHDRVRDSVKKFKNDWMALAEALLRERPSGVVLSAVARTSGSLRQLFLLPSDASFAEAEWIKETVESIFESAGLNVAVMLMDGSGHPCDTSSSTATEWSDYQNVTAMYEALETILESAELQGVPGADICILATPGTTAVGIAAAMTTMNKDCCFEYVTQGGHPEPRYFDIGLDERTQTVDL